MRRSSPWLLAALGYSLLTIVLTWPLVTTIGSVLPHDLGDPMLNAWILWWNAHATPLTERWWNAPMFWPARGAMAMSESLLGLSVLATPLQWMGAGPIAAYNVVFLLSFPLSALAAHALAFTLSERHDGAAIAGLVFGFSPYRIAHLPQIQVQVAFWMPVALAALHLYMRRRETQWLVIFGAAWLLQALSNGYYLLFFPVLVALWVAWFVGFRDRGRPLAAIVSVWAIASLPLVPLLWGYRRIHAMYDMQRGFGEIDGFGADLMSFADASPLMKWWKTPEAVHQAEGELFPGVTAVIIVAIAALSAFAVRRVDRRSRPCVVLLALSIVCAAVALSAAALGPWAIAVGGRTLLSVRVVGKPLTLAMLFLLAALAVEPRMVAAVRRRSALLFYVTAASVMYLLSFGPRPRAFGEIFFYEAPYFWLLKLPGFDGVRVPARFAMLGILCLAVAAALGFAWLTSRQPPRRRIALAALVVLGVLGDSWTESIPLVSMPPRLAMLSAAPADAAVLEFPLGGTEDDTAAMYRSTFHRRPLVNGYSGFFPEHYMILNGALEAADVEVLDQLASSAPLVMVVDTSRPGADTWNALLSRRQGVALLGEEGTRRVFVLPRSSAAPIAAVDVGRPSTLKIESISVSAQPFLAPRLDDGDLNSGWQSGAPQRGTEWVMADVGAGRTIEGVALTLGPYLTDYPRVLAIDVSPDGQAWQTLWTGSTAARAIAFALRDPAQPPLRFSWPGVPARAVRLRQLGRDPKYYWSIAELRVLGR